jgi:hypothetical protein
MLSSQHTVSKSNHPIFPASTPAIFSLAVNTVHSSSLCLDVLHARPPNEKSCRCVNRKDIFFFFFFFLYFSYIFVCVSTLPTELTVSRFGNQSKRKNFSIHLVDGIQSRDSFHPECLRRLSTLLSDRIACSSCIMLVDLLVTRQYLQSSIHIIDYLCLLQFDCSNKAHH